MPPLPSKSAGRTADAARLSFTSLIAALTQTTNRERAALGAIAATFLALLAGGLSYRSAHSGTGAPDGPANIVLSPAPDTGLPDATGGGANGSVEIEARGDSGDAAETIALAAPSANADAAAPGASVAENAATSPATDTAGNANGALVVYVTGAVKRPGVYTFRAGDRLYHAVRAAGGFKASARQDALNLADRLADGDQLYIPPRKATNAAEAVALPAPRRTASAAAPRSAAPSFTPSQGARTMARSLDTPPSSFGGASRARGRVLGEVPPVAVVRVPVAPSSANSESSVGYGGQDSPAPAPAKFKNPGDGVVNLNTASAAELEKISGIGPAMSARILEYRAQIGRFNDPQQLMDVKGIGEKKFAKMQPFVVVQ